MQARSERPTRRWISWVRPDGPLRSRSTRVLVDAGIKPDGRGPVAPNFGALDRIDATVVTHAHLDHCGLLPRFAEIKVAAGYALDMLKKALDSFARVDLAAAASVVKQDRLLDDQFRGILRQLITFMMEDARTISTSIEILFVAKALERIGDHSKNMSEYVVYLVKGKDVRHVTAEEFERETSSD